ncbi:MAG: hypothetical protein MdMp014T_1038 [Treponematales bacterium]
MAKEKEMNEKTEKKRLRKIFRFSWVLGLGFLIGAYFLKQDISGLNENQKFLLLILPLLASLLDNAGIALIVAFFFSFVSSTQHFIAFIQEMLTRIVGGWEFLNKLSQEEKKSMLKTMLKPISNLSSGIGDYIDGYVDDAFHPFNQEFRGVCNLNVTVEYDKRENRVRAETELKYRVYKGKKEKFGNIVTGHENEKDKEVSVTISRPGSEEPFEVTLIRLEGDELKKDDDAKKFKDDPSIKAASVARIPEEFHQYHYLDIEKKFVEFGENHWLLWTFRLTTPCEKLSIHLTCSDGLIVKQFIPYGDVGSFNEDLAPEKDRTSISYNKWMKPGLGVSILVAKKTRGMPVSGGKIRSKSSARKVAVGQIPRLDRG